METISQFKNEFSWLSNFWPVEIYIPEIDPNTYPSNEHFYVAMKTKDPDIRKHVSEILRPGDVKRYGHTKIKNREDWDEIKLRVMEAGLRKKFEHEYLRNKLILTGDCLLIESNSWGDTFWGVDIITNEGNNNLGKLLMKIRKDIIDGR